MLQQFTLNSHSGVFDTSEALSKNRFHKVFEGRLKDNTSVIVKIVVENSEFTTEGREAEMLERLQHVSGVPRFLGYGTLEESGEYSGKKAIITQKVTGSTNLEKMRKAMKKDGNAPTWEMGRNYLFALASILNSVHKEGIAHCDLKLTNILQSNEGHITLIDWDNALDVARDTVNWVKPEKVMATIDFVSTEQLRGKPLDYRTDIYSLGACMALFTYGPNLIQRFEQEKTGEFRLREKKEAADAINKNETIKYHLMPKPTTLDEDVFQQVLRTMTHPKRSERVQTLEAVLKMLS